MPPADSQGGEVPAEGIAAEGQLEVVALADHAAELRVGLLAVQGRVDVRAAGEQEADDPVQQVGRVGRAARGQDQRKPPGLFHRSDVVLSERRGTPASDRRSRS